MGQKLINALNQKSKALVLTPVSVKRLYGRDGEQDYSNGVFRINEGGELQSEFLTVWPIIRDQKLLELAAKRLETRLRKLRTSTPFNRIVTCSPTMRYIMEELRDNFREGNDNLTFEYLGLHPTQGQGVVASRPFSDRDHVAIITDVVSSGALLEEMVRAVEAANAKVVGSLAIFQANYVDPEELDESGKRFKLGPIEELSPSNLRNALVLAHLKKRDRDASIGPIIPIDRTTVYPIDEDSSDSDFDPHLNFNLIMAEQSEIPFLSLGTFRHQDKWLSLSVDIDILLNKLGSKLGDEMGQKVLEAFELKPVKNRRSPRPGRTVAIVTTPGRDNRSFVRFLTQWLNKFGYITRVILIPRSESLGEHYAYFSPERIEFREDEKVFLCLASVGTSEKLRALAAFLAMSGGRQITVLTLLNRMNSASGSFLSRVLNLQGGTDRTPRHVEPGLSLDPSKFRYSSFFKLHDISTQDLMRARQLALQIVRNYESAVDGVFYQSQARNELKYFEPSEPVTDNDRILQLSGYSVRHVSEESLNAVRKALEEQGLPSDSAPEPVLYALCLRALQIESDSSLLRALMQLNTSKEMTYALVRLALLNAAVLDVQGFFTEISKTLIEQAASLEEEKRQAISEAVQDGALDDFEVFNELRENAQEIRRRQFSCFSLLAFASHLRVRRQDRERAQAMLERVISVQQTKADVLNAFLSASDPIFLWSVTFLAHAFGVRENLGEHAKNFFEILVDQHRGLGFSEDEGPVTNDISDLVRDSEQDRNLINEARAFVSDFYLSFGLERDPNAKIPHSKILASIEQSLFSNKNIHHSFNYENISQLHELLESKVEFGGNDQDYSGVVDFSQSEFREEVKLAINRCLIALGDILRIEPGISRLLYARHETDHWATYFSSVDAPSSLASEINSLQRILQPIRTDYELWMHDLTAIKEYARSIIANLWRPNNTGQASSELFEMVRRHSFRAGDLLQEAVKAANRKLEKPRGALVEGDPADSDIYWTLNEDQREGLDFVGFGDVRDLYEAIENALWNAKHSIPALTKPEYRSIECSVEDANNGGPRHLQIRITTLGKRFQPDPDDSPRARTYQEQARKLKMFEGDFQYEQAPGGQNGAVAIITIRETPFQTVEPSDNPWRSGQ